MNNKTNTNSATSTWKGLPLVMESVLPLFKDDMKHYKKQQKRYRKNVPRRPLSAYNIFFRQERLRWLTEEQLGKRVNTKESFLAMGNEIGKRWKSLSPKDREKYEKAAQDDALRYRREMDAYNEKRLLVRMRHTNQTPQLKPQAPKQESRVVFDHVPKVTSSFSTESQPVHRTQPQIASLSQQLQQQQLQQQQLQQQQLQQQQQSQPFMSGLQEQLAQQIIRSMAPAQTDVQPIAAQPQLLSINAYALLNMLQESRALQQQQQQQQQLQLALRTIQGGGDGGVGGVPSTNLLLQLLLQQQLTRR